MSNGDYDLDKKEAKRMKKVFQGIARAYARNKTQIEALALFAPNKKIKGVQAVGKAIRNPRLMKKGAKDMVDWMKRNREAGERLKKSAVKFKRPAMTEEAAQTVVASSIGSAYIGRESARNKSKNKTKPKKKKTFKSQY